MSTRYTADGKRRSSQTHARRAWTCYCGRVVLGNGGKSSHQRACGVYAERRLASLEGLLADESLADTPSRQRWAVERDQLRERLGKAGQGESGAEGSDQS